ncbi:MAG: ytlC [Herbinix sp.]|jgi:NitT/TauT family transport system ATP-binding protein|nr:ytlC [Herbinix sp.]
MGELLKIDHISYTYHSLEGETPALLDVSFNVMDGEFIAIVGPSGCGKSTLLSLIAGLINPSSGFIYINGKDIKSSGKNIGYMLQKDHLLDWRNTMKNVTLGLEIQHRLTDNSYVQINELLNTYGLITFKNSYPSELSGGMRQRAALIRTLLLEPDILLLDEPFSALDYQTRLEVSDDIWGIIRKEKKTAILITHDISEAISMADRIIVLSHRPGSVNSIIDVHLTMDNRTPFAARSAPEFKDYFNLIWKELTHHEQKE